ncbi:MAG: lyase family protein, partial [Spirochaetales bacterium]
MSNKPLWHGRFAEGPDAQAIAFETSIHIDSRLVFDDIRGSIAHVHMLGNQGIISKEDSEKIAQTLSAVSLELTDGSLQIDTTCEDIHSFIEMILTDRLGDVGKKVHAGRSRNDQIALDERLYLRHAVPELCQRIVTLISTLTEIAAKHTDSLVSGYTHLQRAQPVTLAHHLCAWAWMLKRDYERLADAVKRIDFCPLGAGALASSGLPLDRKAVADELGFSDITANSL